MSTFGTYSSLAGSGGGGGGSGITALTGDVTATGPGSAASTISNSAVSNAKLAHMLDGTIKGNNSGSTGSPIDLTSIEVTAMLAVVVGDSGSGGTQGLVPAPAAGDAAAGKYLAASGTWSVPPGAAGITGPVSSTVNAIPIWNSGIGASLADTGVTIDTFNNLITPSGLTITGSTPTINIGGIAPAVTSSITGDSSSNLNFTNQAVGNFNFISGTSQMMTIYSSSAGGDILFTPGNLVASSASGFAFLPSVGADPTGTPATYPGGYSPVVVNTNRDCLSFYASGTWKKTPVVAGVTGNLQINGGTDILSPIAAGTDGQYLTIQSGYPLWATANFSPGGTSGQIQTNNGSGGFGGISTVPYSMVGSVGAGNAVMVSDASGNPSVLSTGSTGQVLSMSGGVPVWATNSATPGGASGDVQVNSGGSFGGITGVTANITASPITSMLVNTGIVVSVAATTPVADGTYTVGLGLTTNGTITIVSGVITAITQAS